MLDARQAAKVLIGKCTCSAGVPPAVFGSAPMTKKPPARRQRHEIGWHSKNCSARDVPETAVAKYTNQCLKCLTPQNTIAIPIRSAAAITSESRTEPPG